MKNYQKIQILRKRDLDLYVLFKRYKEEIKDWDDSWFIKVSVSRYYPQRTVPQHKYWRALMNIFADFTGMDPQEAHQYWLGRFAPTRTKMIEATGEEVEYRLTTSMMNTQEMTQFIDKVKLASMEEIGCYLQSPNESLKLELD